MFEPIDIVHSIHNAFRRDIFQIDDLVLKTTLANGDLTSVLDRFHIMGEVLDYHARGEEAAVFPAVGNLAPLVPPTYFLDHRELDNMVGVLEDLRKSPDHIATARATAVLKSHLRIHLDKEDAFLYPLLKEKTTISEQASIAGAMSKKVPPDRFPDLVHWLMPLLDLNDQEVVAKGWMTLMPPQVFANVKLLIKKNVGANWLELTRLIPGLEIE
ncbi:MAG TPA: hemerythrin domain-containing protein [Candidatus Nanoarchaeia archaeon]|nr:hemerythrin domain-containing protein [Candidatus Nanoarchaeia archaeon]